MATFWCGRTCFFALIVTVCGASQVKADQSTEEFASSDMPILRMGTCWSFRVASAFGPQSAPVEMMMRCPKSLVPEADRNVSISFFETWWSGA